MSRARTSQVIQGPAVPTARRSTGSGKNYLRPTSGLSRTNPASSAFVDDASEDESNVGGAFSKPSHEIGKPFTAEGNVYAHPVTV